MRLCFFDIRRRPVLKHSDGQQAIAFDTGGNGSERGTNLGVEAVTVHAEVIGAVLQANESLRQNLESAAGQHCVSGHGSVSRAALPRSGRGPSCTGLRRGFLFMRALLMLSLLSFLKLNR